VTRLLLNLRNLVDAATAAAAAAAMNIAWGRASRCAVCRRQISARGRSGAPASPRLVCKTGHYGGPNGAARWSEFDGGVLTASDEP